MACTSYLMALVLGLVPSELENLSDSARLEHAATMFARGLQVRAQRGDAKALFQDAARSYSALLRGGARNAGLYRNLGNASLLADDLPAAILAYRLGLQMTPDERALRTGLDFARAQVAYPESNGFARPPSEQRPPWLPHVRPGWQLIFTVLLYCGAWFALTRWWMLRRAGALGAAALAITGAAILGANWFAEQRNLREETLHPIVVIADDGVLVRSGNGLSYPPRYETPVNRGVEGRVLYVRGNWLQIELSGGEVGWVPAAYTLRAEDLIGRGAIAPGS